MSPPAPMLQPALPPMREVTEDMPADMLAGAMDLRVLLPDGHAVKMNVDRSTPMMDLLVHVTTANKMSTGGHIIQAIGEKGNILPYKPSTPIGALDTWTIQIVSKSKVSGVGHKKAPLKPSNQPFEQTFRLQVNLPRNQLFVTRVSPRTPLLDVLRHVCSEKGLDPDKYDLRNPANPEEVLHLTCNLFDYKLQEVTVAQRGSGVPPHHHRTNASSAADIISLQRQQSGSDIGDKRRKTGGSSTTTNSSSGGGGSTTNNSGSGVLGFIRFKRGSRSSVCEGSISSDSLGGQSISPARSDESLGPLRSTSPALPQAPSRGIVLGATQDHLRNQINRQMSQRQENMSQHPVVSLEKSLKKRNVDEKQQQPQQAPPPPVRHRKRRAPKPPVLNNGTPSEAKKSSDFIMAAPAAPVAVARRKSLPVNDEEEYDEEDIMAARNIHGRCKTKGDGGGGTSTAAATLISHSRNSSDSSGYHEASVLSESPESGLGTSGAPDTLPRRKVQQQRSVGGASTHAPPFSRSMGNLASSAPPTSSTLMTSSKNISSSSYSSLSMSTSSLPGQKKKKAPAPPPPPTAPVVTSASDWKHGDMVEITSKADILSYPKNDVSSSTSTFKRTNDESLNRNGKNESVVYLERRFTPEPKVNSNIVSESLKSEKRPASLSSIQNESLFETEVPNSSINHANSSLENLAANPVGCASKPASVNKPGPAVAPKPHTKANVSAGVSQRQIRNSQDDEMLEESDGAIDMMINPETENSVDEVDDVSHQTEEEEVMIEDRDEIVKPLVFGETGNERLHGDFEEVMPATILPCPPPSLEYNQDSTCKPLEVDDRREEESEFEWEYKLPAPPTGFQDEDEAKRDGAEMHDEIREDAKVEVPKEEPWVAESETASMPSTFSSAASHHVGKPWGPEGRPVQHLPNFRMSTYDRNVGSEDGWENLREDLGRERKCVEEGLESKSVTVKDGTSSSVFPISEGGGVDGVEKGGSRDVNKTSCPDGWDVSLSPKSSSNKAHYSNLDLRNPMPSSYVMYHKDVVRKEVEPDESMKNSSSVIRVSSFGGKPSSVLKRSLSSTSSLVSRHCGNDGQNVEEKLRKEVDRNVSRSCVSHIRLGNGTENSFLSNSSRAISLYNLDIKPIGEEKRIMGGESLSNGFHSESTIPKIVSSKWKKSQGAINSNQTGSCGLCDSTNLRKTSSDLSLSNGFCPKEWKEDKSEKGECADDAQGGSLQERFLVRRECKLKNKSAVLEGNSDAPLKSFQLLKGVMPRFAKKSLGRETNEKVERDNVNSEGIGSLEKTLEWDGIDEKKDERVSSDLESITRQVQSNFSFDNKSNSLPTPDHSSPHTTPQGMEYVPKRYSYAGPPAINFGTWNERPKSEVSLKRDSDYRIGVGQAPRLNMKEYYSQPSLIPSGSLPPCKTSFSNQSSSGQLDSAPPCPPPKPTPTNSLVVNIVSATKQEPVSRLPIVRAVELKKTASASLTKTIPKMMPNGNFPSDLREELTGALAILVDANQKQGEGKIGGEELNERRRRQQIPCSGSNEVLPPPPPPDVTITTPRLLTTVSGTNLRRGGSSVGQEGIARVSNGFMVGQEKRHGSILPFAPVVKGFRMNAIQMQSLSAPAQPPPPPAVVCGVALKKRMEPSNFPKNRENQRDDLLSAIRDFGGRGNLKKTADNYY